MINSFFSLTAVANDYLYNCCFCIYIILFIRNVIFGTKIPKLLFHIVCLLGTIGFLCFVFFLNIMGKSLFGTCFNYILLDFQFMFYFFYQGSIQAISTIPIYGNSLFFYLKNNKILKIGLVPVVFYIMLGLFTTYYF